jgi:hypothetical protein
MTSTRPRRRALIAGGAGLSALLAACFLAIPAPRVAFAEEVTGSDRIIVLINPNSNAKTTASMTEIAARATGGVAVVGRSNEGVPPLLTTPKDLADALPGVVRIGVEAAEDERVGAIIVAAFGDPGLAELRAAVDLPVSASPSRRPSATPSSSAAPGPPPAIRTS